MRRISLPDFKEDAALEAGKKCGWLSVSAEGVVLTANEAQEMWLLDGKSLKVIKKQDPDGTITVARSDIYGGAIIPFVPFTKLDGGVIKGTHNG